MALEKQTLIRKIEFVLTDDQVHPEASVLFIDSVLEDGTEIAASNRRDQMSWGDAMQLLSGKTTYVHPSSEL